MGLLDKKMKLRLHHLEMCVKDPITVMRVLCSQFGFSYAGRRATFSKHQFLAQLGGTTFVISSRKCIMSNSNRELLKTTEGEYLDDTDYMSTCCCDKDRHEYINHIDSVFNVVLEVKDLGYHVSRIKDNSTTVIQDVETVWERSKENYIVYASVRSICGNVIHTLVNKDNYHGWFLPGFKRVKSSDCDLWKIFMCNEANAKTGDLVTHLDHIALACRVGQSDEILAWYEKNFQMKRFLMNRDDSEKDGLIIGDDVGMRLKVMEFWRCSENGLASHCDSEWEPLKIVVAESLPNISNQQIENFIRDHGTPGLQHVGLSTTDIYHVVQQMTENGVSFRQPPASYYTDLGQLDVILKVGKDPNKLKSFGILLDDEADIFEEKGKEKYLMQVFTRPIFDRDTFFLEVIQRNGARGFGVGNVTALARSLQAAYKDDSAKGSVY